MNTIIQTAENRRYDYRSLREKMDVVGDTSAAVDLNIVIGIRGRREYLATTVKHMNEARKMSRIKTRLVVVEMDECPLSRDVDADVYIFVPASQTNTDNMYSRALAFNIGYYINSRSKYYLFHDCDIVVPVDFFEVIENSYIKDDFRWLQTFTKKRLLMLDRKSTEDVFKGEMSVEESSHYPAQSGAAGGSTLVSKETFESVGGFDPELFFGYAPEDSMFLTKLACLEKAIDEISSCHQLGPEHYADDPPIEMYHLYHKTMSQENPLFLKMTKIHGEYWSQSYCQKMEYIEYKRSLLIEDNQRVSIK